MMLRVSLVLAACTGIEALKSGDQRSTLLFGQTAQTDYCTGRRCRMDGELLWYIQTSESLGPTMCELAKHHEYINPNNNCKGDEELMAVTRHAGERQRDAEDVWRLMRVTGYTAVLTESDHPTKFLQSAVLGGASFPFHNSAIVFFTITRDPMDRWLSQYYSTHREAPGPGNFSTFVLSQPDNFMTRMFLHGGSDRPLLTADDFDEMKRLLKAFVLVLPMESVERSVPIMRQVLGWNRLLQMNHEGVSRQRNMEAAMTEVEYQKVMQHCKWDLAFHQLVKENFQNDFGGGVAPSDSLRHPSEAFRVQQEGESIADSEGEGSSVEGVGRSICGFSEGRLRCPGLRWSSGD